MYCHLLIFPDVVILKNGQEIQGIIKEDAKDFIDITTAEKVKLRIQKDKIKEIIKKEFSFPETTPIPTPTKSISNNADELIKTAKAFLDKLNKKEALVYLEKAVKIAPDNPEANYLLAQCYENEEKNQLAYDYYLKAISLDKEKYLSFSSKQLIKLSDSLINKYASEKKDEVALQILITRIEVYPEETSQNLTTDFDIGNDANKYSLAGLIAVRNNQFSLAKLAFKKVLEIEPNNKKAQGELETLFSEDFTTATKHFNNRNFKASRDIVEKMLSFYPDYKSANDLLQLIKTEEKIQSEYDGLISAYKKGNYEDVRAGISYLSDSYPHSTIIPYATALYKLCMARTKINDLNYDEAIKICNEISNLKVQDDWLSEEVKNVISIAQEKKQADEMLADGKRLIENKEFEKAIKFYEDIINKYPNSYTSKVALELKNKAISEQYWYDEELRKKKLADEEAERLRPKLGNLSGVVKVFKDNRTGTVPDPSAVITIGSIADPQQSVQTTTDKDGNYQFENLSIGEYKVTCQFSLQNKTKSLNIIIEDKATKTLDFYWSKADILGL